MALRMICLFFLVALLHLNSGELGKVPVKVTVINDLNGEQVSYTGEVVEEGLLFGVLNFLKNSASNDFNFDYSIHKDFGIFLESVNGLAESNEDQTYWELLSEKAGTVTRLDVGIGCYQPQKDETIILKFTNWTKK